MNQPQPFRRVWRIIRAAPLLLALIRTASAATAADKSHRQGIVLLGDLNCTACHASSPTQAIWLSPKFAPTLTELGTRANPDWTHQFLASPQATLPASTMPDVLGDFSPSDRESVAEALTHYLYSLSPSRWKRTAPDRSAVARGETLFHQIGCAACHPAQLRGTKALSGVPLPRMEEKWSFEGLKAFLHDPLATRPSGRMPSLSLTEKESFDIAHYLLRKNRLYSPIEVSACQEWIRSLHDLDQAEFISTTPANDFSLEAPNGSNWRGLRFRGWLKVERAGDYTVHITADGAARLAIDGRWIEDEDALENDETKASGVFHLEQGWRPLIVDFARRGRKTPALRLEWEGPEIPRQPLATATLRADPAVGPMPAAPVFNVDPTKAARGQALFSELGCAVCHASQPPDRQLPTLTGLRPFGGCLADKPSAGAPDFHLSPSQRVSLQEALADLNKPILPSPSPGEQLALALSSFRCTACHSRDGAGGVTPDRESIFASGGEDLGDEGRIPPRLDGVGDKLRPEWLRRVLTQGAAVRPYLKTRMPQFGAVNVGRLADLFVQLDRHPRPVATFPDSLEAHKEAGRRMIGTDGLSCIGCHRFHGQPALALQVLDLLTTPERLNEDWFRQFLLDPNRFNPGTRMPSFWPGGLSPLPGLLDGDTARQEAAIWSYLAGGSSAKFPEGLSRESLELVVGGEAVVYRGKLWEAGFRAVATGYPGQVNAAFDAEEMRLSLLWRGRFLNVAPHWTVQGMGRIHPLGTDIAVFPPGSALAVLANNNSPWPTNSSKELGAKFHGYQLDSLKRPTLLYSFNGVSVEDFITGPVVNEKPAIHRTLELKGVAPKGLSLRLAAGKIRGLGPNEWRVDDAITIHILGEGLAFSRGTGNRAEIILPLLIPNGEVILEVDYVW